MKIKFKKMHPSAHTKIIIMSIQEIATFYLEKIPGPNSTRHWYQTMCRERMKHLITQWLELRMVDETTKNKLLKLEL